jgi:hypothetical protein
MDLEQLFIDNKEQSITGRYLPLESIEPILQRLNTDNQLSVLVNQYCKTNLSLSDWRKKKILLWSQMHEMKVLPQKRCLTLNVLQNGSALADQLL